jgi:hypothetical protein
MNKIGILLWSLPLVLCGQGDLYPLEEYYGGGIGYSPTYITLDSIPGASSLTKLGLNPKNFSQPFVLHGGEGFTHIAGRWRIGGYAGVGASRISTVPPVVLFVNRDGVEGYQPPPAVVTDWSVIDTAVTYTGDFAPAIEAKFTFALGAFTAEYVLPLFRDLEIATGALLGVGRISLSLDQHAGTPRWDKAFTNMYGEIIDSTLYYEVNTVNDLVTNQSGGLLSGSVANQMTEVSGTFFNFQPYIAVKWQMLDRVGLRVSVGFNKGTIPAGRWYLNGREPISDSPRSAVQGVAIRTMLYFGL